MALIYKRGDASVMDNPAENAKVTIFERLGTTIRDTPMDVGRLDRLTAAAECYITFGRREPALFRLMFSKELGQVDKGQPEQC